MITSGKEYDLNLRCPYQAKVMKIFDASNMMIGSAKGETAVGMDNLSGKQATQEF
jgi:hypothetical protein